MTIGFYLGHDIDLVFSRSNMEFSISRPKMVRLLRNKKQACLLNSKLQMWPSDLTLAITLTLNLQGQIGICYISAKNGPIAMKQIANISTELCSSNVTIWFDLGHDLDYEFSRSNLEFAISQPKMVWLSQNEKYTNRMNMNWRTQWPSSLTLAITLKGEV